MARSFGHEDAGRATAESLSEIVKNYGISGFLETNDKRYLVGPKGTGKTLLLMRKAIDQRKKGNAICIPSNPDLPVDRLTAAQHVGKYFHYSVKDASESNLAWATVWKHSIFRSVLHHVREQVLTEIEQSPSGRTPDSWSTELEYSRLKAARRLLDRLVTGMSPFPERPYYYFTELGDKLDSSPRPTLKNARQEIAEMDSILQAVRQDVYVFLDNLDDYYEREPELWFYSMYGQLRAVREISLTHRNIQVFTTIRLDVYNQFSDEMRLQYYDYIVQLEYSKEELLEIFESHIAHLDKDLLAQPGLRKQDPWRAFFGNCRVIPNESIGVNEDVRDYIFRHTLARPRDVIHMGAVLLAKRPRDGFDLDSVSEAVLVASRDIGEQYLAEVSPMLDPRFSIKELIRDFSPSNILTRDQVDKCTNDYVASLKDLYDDSVPSDRTRPLQTLYELGLLGYAKRRGHTGKYLQYFMPPGQGLSSPEDRPLPESNLYFLHPVLNHYLPIKRVSNRMIVGKDFPVY